MGYPNLATLEYRLTTLDSSIEDREFSDVVRLRLAYPAHQRVALESLLQVMGASWDE